jgi:proline iminopeptidase
MKKKIISIIKISFLLGSIIFLIYIFYPRKYNVMPYKKMGDTNFWTLSTGSHIGYIHIAAKGRRKSYPIIYLHGGPGGAITEKIISMLRPFSDEGYDIYAYDQAGSGSSERFDDIEEYTAERHTSDLLQIVKKIDAEKVILMGQSWGSVLATLFTLNNPNKVDQIIMTSPGPIFPINKGLSELKAPDSLNLKESLISNQVGNEEVYTFRDKCIMWYAHSIGYKLIPDKEADNFFTLLNSSLKRSTVRDTSLAEESSSGGGYYAHLMTLKSLFHIKDSREEMKKSKVNILIMKGQYDNQKWGFTNEYLELFQNAKIKIIPKAGHDIHLEQAQLYYKEINEFLRNKIEISTTQDMLHIQS